MDVATYLESIRRKIPQAKEELSPGALEMHLGEAVRYYSHVDPRISVKDYTGDGTTYNFSLPKVWEPGFSRVRSIEYPAGEQEPEFLSLGDYEVYQASTDVFQLRLHDTPSDGEVLRLIYTSPHRLNVDEDTIPSYHRDAVTCLAAAYVAWNLAAKYAGFTDPSLVGDVINYRTKEREYQSVGDQFLVCFWNYFGVDVKGRKSLVPAAGAYARFDYDLHTRYGIAPP